MSAPIHSLIARATAQNLSEAAVYRASRREVSGTQGTGGAADGRFFCPVCESWHWRFLPYGRNGRPNALCPTCGSVERHRFLWLTLAPLLSRARRIVHVAPEPGIRARLEGLPGVQYRAVDRYDPDAEPMDLTELLMPDNSADLIICNHVLEHIPDDRQAMAEMLRVLRPGGHAVVMVPVDEKRPRTYEDDSIVSPADRAVAFGHPYHVRVCGADYPERLEAAGFAVEYRHSRSLSGHKRRLMRLNKTPLYLCRKPA
jgi:SAM-dependent methyltransferase